MPHRIENVKLNKSKGFSFIKLQNRLADLIRGHHCVY